jgi:hypothetical protein
LGIVEGVGARVLYLVDHLLRRVVVLDLRYDLVLAGREVQVRQVLLELSQVEIAKVAQITQVTKTHVRVPPNSLSINVKGLSTRFVLCQTNASTVREGLLRLPDLEPECLISELFGCAEGFLHEPERLFSAAPGEGDA